MAWLNLNPAQQKILKSVIEKLLLWLGFNVLVAVLPFGFRAVLMQLESKPIDAVQIFADEELLIVATAISAAAVGELIVSTSKARIFKIICGACSVVAIGMSTFIFAVVKAKSGIVEIPSSVTVVNWSLGIF